MGERFREGFAIAAAPNAGGAIFTPGQDPFAISTKNRPPELGRAIGLPSQKSFAIRTPHSFRGLGCRTLGVHQRHGRDRIGFRVPQVRRAVLAVDENILPIRLKTGPADRTLK